MEVSRGEKALCVVCLVIILHASHENASLQGLRELSLVLQRDLWFAMDECAIRSPLNQVPWTEISGVCSRSALAGVEET